MYLQNFTDIVRIEMENTKKVFRSRISVLYLGVILAPFIIIMIASGLAIMRGMLLVGGALLFVVVINVFYMTGVRACCTTSQR